MKAAKKARDATALDRLRETAPKGPPFIWIMFDLPTVKALAGGVVNSRAEVAARRALASFEAGCLGKKREDV